MIDSVFSYWSVVVPTLVTGAILLGALAKKARDEKARKEKVLVPIPVEKRRG